MAEAVSEFLKNYLSPELVIFIISLMPILELRGALLVAGPVFHMPWTVAAPIAVLGNMIPIPFIIFFIRPVLSFLQKHGPIKKFAKWIEQKGYKAGDKLKEKHPASLWLGLFLFVAIPLPGTGAWTGSLAAALLGLKPKFCILPLCLGVLGACIIMSVISYVIPGAFGLYQIV